MGCNPSWGRVWQSWQREKMSEFGGNMNWNLWVCGTLFNLQDAIQAPSRMLCPLLLLEWCFWEGRGGILWRRDSTGQRQKGKLRTCQTLKKRTGIIFVICLFPCKYSQSREQGWGWCEGCVTEQMGKGSCPNTAPVTTQGLWSSVMVYKLWNTENFL